MKTKDLADTEKPVGKNRPWLLGLGALLAGLSNGLLGSGGGMFLWFALSKFSPCQPRQVFATGAASILCFSLLSALFYFISGQITIDALSWYLLPAIGGGVLGAFLLGKFKVGFLRQLFAMLLVFSGIVLWVR